MKKYGMQFCATLRELCTFYLVVVPTADSRSERLHVLLITSSNCHRLTHIYVLPYPAIADASGLSKEINAILE